MDPVSGESNTGNNCSSGVQITVREETHPDLIVQTPSVSDTTLSPGQSFMASATVRNQGNGTSSSTTLRYYRSANSTISTSDTQISTDPVSSLSAGGTSPESATVTAPSSPGTYWIGACVDPVSGESNTGNNCSSGVQVSVYMPRYTLSVTKYGSGVIIGDNGYISCGSNCSHTYPERTNIVLTASPADGWKFDGWGGACSGTGSCLVTMTDDKDVIATFTQLPPTMRSLTVSKTGNGTITSSPAGISCGNDCSESYAEGTIVTLTASPASGWNFTGWSKDCAGTGACVVNLTGNRVVRALFTRQPQSGDQYEPDDTPATATPIDNNIPQVHSIIPANDVDWVIFTLTEPSDVLLETSGISGDTRMWLYDDKMNEIAFSDDANGSLFSAINITGLSAGTYYVKVDELYNNDEIANYTLTLNYSSAGGGGSKKSKFPWSLFLRLIMSGRSL